VKVSLAAGEAHLFWDFPGAESWGRSSGLMQFGGPDFPGLRPSKTDPQSLLAASSNS
jgi:hypothetical protein